MQVHAEGCMMCVFKHAACRSSILLRDGLEVLSQKGQARGSQGRIPARSSAPRIAVPSLLGGIERRTTERYTGVTQLRLRGAYSQRSRGL